MKTNLIANRSGNVSALNAISVCLLSCDVLKSVNSYIFVGYKQPYLENSNHFLGYSISCASNICKCIISRIFFWLWAL